MLVLLKNIHIHYKVTFLQAIGDVFKPVIGYRNINISGLLIKLFINVRRDFLLNRRCPTLWN